MKYTIEFNSEVWRATPAALALLVVQACKRSTTGTVTVKVYS